MKGRWGKVVDGFLYEHLHNPLLNQTFATSLEILRV